MLQFILHLRQDVHIQALCQNKTVIVNFHLFSILFIM